MTDVAISCADKLWRIFLKILKVQPIRLPSYHFLWWVVHVGIHRTEEQYLRWGMAAT